MLTEVRAAPQAWLPKLKDSEVLCLAGGGGQQGPLLAAAGARVTVVDNSPAQLSADRRVAERASLSLRLLEGDMCDLSGFAENHFDLIIIPNSTLYVPDVRVVWRECFRVLRRGGSLLAGFVNPAYFIFDLDLQLETGELKVRYNLPYSDLESLPEERLGELMREGDPLEFSHTLEDQIGGQMEAGFVLTGFVEDRQWAEALDHYMPTLIATRALKP
jgi:SAM-dependent methyltransferase